MPQVDADAVRVLTDKIQAQTTTVIVKAQQAAQAQTSHAIENQKLVDLQLELNDLLDAAT